MYGVFFVESCQANPKSSATGTGPPFFFYTEVFDAAMPALRLFSGCPVTVCYASVGNFAVVQ